MNVVKKILALALTVLSVIGIYAAGIRVQAATPRVMLSEYSLNADTIYAGDTFTLSFKLKNTSKNTVTNLKYTVAAEGGEFLPVESTGSGYVAELKGNAEEELSVELSAVRGLEEKSYRLIVRSEYEDWNGGYTGEDIIYIPINLRTEIIISDTYIAEEDIRLGDNIEILSTINNVGGADIYKVTATVAGENIAEATGFLGNIEAGKSATVDIITKATSIAKPDTTVNDITITYEDIKGNKNSEVIHLGKIEVIEQDYSDIIQVKEDTTRHFSSVDKLEIIIIAVVLIIILMVVMRRLKRRRLEKEFE